MSEVAQEKPSMPQGGVTVAEMSEISAERREEILRAVCSRMRMKDSFGYALMFFFGYGHVVFEHGRRPPGARAMAKSDRLALIGLPKGELKLFKNTLTEEESSAIHEAAEAYAGHPVEKGE